MSYKMVLSLQMLVCVYIYISHKKGHNTKIIAVIKIKLFTLSFKERKMIKKNKIPTSLHEQPYTGLMEHLLTVKLYKRYFTLKCLENVKVEIKI